MDSTAKKICNMGIKAILEGGKALCTGVIVILGIIGKVTGRGGE